MVEYRDGELEEELAASMQLHLGSCHECAAELKALESERELYNKYRQALERGLEVDRGMWARIHGRISPSAARTEAARRLIASESPNPGLSGSVLGHRFLRQAAMAAALVCISVAATLFAVRYFDQLKTHPGDLSPGSRPSIVAHDTNRSPGDGKSLEGAMRAIRKAEQDYIDAIGMLSDIADKRKPTLDPRLVLELERNLKAIDESIEAARKAYYSHPSDPYLAQYMLTSYSRKVELLQEITS
jgi:hypothetical protein